MDDRFNNPFITGQEDSENSPENTSDMPPSGMFHDSTPASTPSRRRSRRAIKKRVVSVPIKDVEGSKAKSEISIPPPDSWSWRKYGQKPIKGSPYPRGYYRCSSSKGCPARKQVERSRLDPNMLVVTYFGEHNHPCPTSRNNHIHRTNKIVSVNNIVAATNTLTSIIVSYNKKEADARSFSTEQEINSNEKFNLSESSLIEGNEIGWFLEFKPTTSSSIVESSCSILTEVEITNTDMPVIFAKREEDESLFADLGELPECSREFGRGTIEWNEERGQPADIA